MVKRRSKGKAPGKRKAKVTKRKVLAMVSDAEARELLANRDTLNHFTRAYHLMLQGQRTFWFTLRRKYDLPAEIDYNYETGAVYEKQPKVPTRDSAVARLAPLSGKKG